jgi:YgiT-type zinc finger domain-containing protein
MNRYSDCTYCGGEVVEQTIDYDYRRQKHLMVVSNVPAGVCRQCGEKYFKPDISRYLRAPRKATANLNRACRIALANLATRSTNNSVVISTFREFSKRGNSTRNEHGQLFGRASATNTVLFLSLSPGTDHIARMPETSEVAVNVDAGTTDHEYEHGSSPLHDHGDFRTRDPGTALLPSFAFSFDPSFLF